MRLAAIRAALSCYAIAALVRKMAEKSRWPHYGCKLYHERQRVGAAPRVVELV
jgi:hypothetical protein